jgi:hypothetical protein
MVEDAEFIPVNAHYSVDLGDSGGTDEEEKLRHLTESLQGEAGAFVSVHREVSGMNNAEYVTRLPVDKWDHAQILENLRRDFGGGDYRLRVYVKGKVKANRLFTVASKIGGDGGAVSGDSNLRLVMDRMEKMNQQMLALAGTANSAGSSRQEMIQEMLMMKQLFDSPARGSGGVGELLEMVQGLKSLGIKIGGDVEDSGSGFGGLLELMGPVIANMQTKQIVAPVVTGEANQRLVSRETMPKASVKVEKSDMSIALNFGLDQMIKAAAKGCDPANYAGMIVDNVPQSVIDGFFGDDRGFDKLVQLKPAIANYKDWFLLLGEHVKAVLGLHSTVSDLYLDGEDDSVAENIEVKPVDKPSIQVDANTKRQRGNTRNPKDHVGDGKKV